VIHPADEPTMARWDDHLALLLARTDLSVVLFGESGVGKTAAAEVLVAESAGRACLLDDIMLLPRELPERFVATTRRHDLSAPPGGIALLIPPLRDRPREIAPLAARLLHETSARAGNKMPRISREALGALVRHSWLGNLRELRSTMEHAMVLAQGREIEPKHLVFESAPLPPQTLQTLPPSAPSSVPPRR
jgi:DNA-binding NtrC family response regulator